ncbi:amino acid ABC transporter [Pandoraea thiooxydans]|uniref:Amino acid ABC transporter n=1 Tax=Pandoraea thiooxydans TaxID=445709 RepID=A0A0G3ELY1_9BURK|nr:transporter substrate-binding domain-containing protein [Pandoraea thiooxydans]AKJ67950.1 amino acid ABC transporter [Pandoraea thiooxydans]APR95163.1 amino acid ABC transporter [Pandoraea thiooxydans]
MKSFSIFKRGALSLCACAVTLATLTVTAHAEDLLAKVKHDGVLTIGTEMQFAPFDFLQNGQHEGFNKDFFNEVGKELGVKVKFLDLPWPSVLPGLEAGKFELVGGPVTITKARMARYAFTLPIADATTALLKRADDKSINKPQDIAGKPVGGGKGSAQLAQLQAYVAHLPGKADIREYIDNNQAYADLAAGRIDAVGNSLPNLAYVAKQRPKVFAVVLPTFGAKTYFGFVGRKDADSRALIDAVDKIIIEMDKDGRMAALQKKWFGLAMDMPQTMPAINF